MGKQAQPPSQLKRMWPMRSVYTDAATAITSFPNGNCMVAWLASIGNCNAAVVKIKVHPVSALILNGLFQR